MPNRALLLSIGLLVVTAGCLAGAAPAAMVTVQNHRAAEYSMTAYVFEEPVGAGNVSFRATTAAGNRTTADLERLETDGPYYDVAVGNEWNVTERQVTVPADETTTATIDAWEPGDAVVYLFETTDGRVVTSEFAECPDGSLNHSFTFDTGPEYGHRMTCS